MEKKYQVFISSTYIDLREERTKVRDAILSMYHFPVGMELFGAADEEQWQIIQETIDSSDYYVLLIAHRYGSIIPAGPDVGISYTEKEFRYAREKKIPILAFLLDNQARVDPANVEKEHSDALVAFKEEVMNGRIVQWWTNPDDLAQKVTAALYKQITRTKRPGWIRGDSVDIEKSLAEIVELNQQVRALQDRNNELEAENRKLKGESERSPELVFYLEPDAGDEKEKDKDGGLFSRSSRMTRDDQNRIHLKVGSVSENPVVAEYSPMSMSDFPGRFSCFITEEEIEQYNQALPSEKEIEAYIREYKLYKLKKEHGIAVAINVGNVGTAKASGVSITIEFPQEIRVFSVSEVENETEPKAPSAPRNLLEVASERLNKAMLPSVFSDYGHFSPVVIPEVPFVRADSFLSEANDVEIDGNTLEIHLRRDIVHTKHYCCRDFYLVPTTTGEFQAKVTLMCAEYLQPKESFITFVCE